MAVINFKKIDGILPMLIQFFPDSSSVSEIYLKSKVEEDIILAAKEEGFIHFVSDAYKITEKGKTYRDKGIY